MASCWPQNPAWETHGSQQQALSEESGVPLLLKPVLVETLQHEQKYILGLYLDELFDAPPEEQSAMEPARKDRSCPGAW